MFKVTGSRLAWITGRTYCAIPVFLLLTLLNANAIIVTIDIANKHQQTFESLFADDQYEQPFKNLTLAATEGSHPFFAGLALRDDEKDPRYLKMRAFRNPGSEIKINKEIDSRGISILKNLSLMMKIGPADFLEMKKWPMSTGTYSAADLAQKLLNIPEAVFPQMLSSPIPKDQLIDMLSNIKKMAGLLFFTGKTTRLEGVDLPRFEVYYALVSLSEETYILIHSFNIIFLDFNQLSEFLTIADSRAHEIKMFSSAEIFNKSAEDFLDPRLQK